MGQSNRTGRRLREEWRSSIADVLTKARGQAKVSVAPSFKFSYTTHHGKILMGSPLLGHDSREIQVKYENYNCRQMSVCLRNDKIVEH